MTTRSTLLEVRQHSAHGRPARKRPHSAPARRGNRSTKRRATAPPKRAGLVLTPELVFEQYAARVYNLARRMVSNETDAEDIAQDVLVLVIRKLGTFRGEAEFTTWLHRVTVNAVLVFRRKRAPRLAKEERAPLDYFLAQGVVETGACCRSPRPEQEAIGREVRQQLENAIAGLPLLYRDVFVLADIEGLANAEIGAVLGLSLAAVKSRLHRARLLLREVLAPYFRERAAS